MHTDLANTACKLVRSCIWICHELHLDLSKDAIGWFNSVVDFLETARDFCRICQNLHVEMSEKAYGFVRSGLSICQKLHVVVQELYFFCEKLYYDLPEYEW